MTNDLTIHLPKVEEVNMEGKKVLVRGDLEWEGENSPREKATREIVGYLHQQGAKRIKVIGHKGNISQVVELGVDVNWDLRADPREETNDPTLAEELAEDFDIYINEAFATSHRKHCSIDALPRWMKKQGQEVGVGLRFAKEIDVLGRAKPGVVVIGGGKEDKEKYAQALEKKGWTVLRGGLLPGADLRPDGLDISDAAIADFKNKLSQAEVIVVAGPMGKYDNGQADKGTREVFTAVAQSQAYKIAGGGDTEAALEKFGIKDKFDWISVGGGAMLEFLATGTLPGIQALIS